MKSLDDWILDSFFERVDSGELIYLNPEVCMEKKKMKARNMSDTKPRYFRVLKTGKIGLYCGKLPVRVPDPSAVYINPVCLNFNGEYRFYNSEAVEEETFESVSHRHDK